LPLLDCLKLSPTNQKLAPATKSDQSEGLEKPKLTGRDGAGGAVVAEAGLKVGPGSGGCQALGRGGGGCGLTLEKPVTHFTYINYSTRILQLPGLRQRYSGGCGLELENPVEKLCSKYCTTQP
jgi:hypothetical protein